MTGAPAYDKALASAAEALDPAALDQLENDLTSLFRECGMDEWLDHVLAPKWAPLFARVGTEALLAGAMLPAMVSRACGIVRLEADSDPAIARLIRSPASKRERAAQRLLAASRGLLIDDPANERKLRRDRAALGRSRPPGRPTKK